MTGVSGSGMTAEISFDLVAEEDMEFEEGTFRLPGGEWQVFIVSKRPAVVPEVKPTRWDSGVSGVFVAFPVEARLDRSAVGLLLGEALGVSGWVEVCGPDSMDLR